MAIAEWVLTGGLLAGIGYTCVRSLASGGRRSRLRLLAVRRAPRARRAAAEAALDDPAFSPESIEAAVQNMLPDVLGNDAQPVGRPRVTILAVVNRERDTEDRVVVQELAEPVPGGPPAAELVDSDTPPPRQLADLSLADDRFEPMLIEAALSRIVQAWEESDDDGDAPLLAVATGAGAHALQFPAHERGRRGIRDGRLERWEVTRVNTAATPAQVEVRVDLRATPAGDRRPRRLTLLWTLALDEARHGRPRWRLTHSADAT